MYEFIYNKEFEKVLLEHTINGGQVEEKCIEVLRYAYSQLISRILLQFKLFIDNENKLKTFEKLYEVMKKLKGDLENYLKDTETIHDLIGDEKIIIKNIQEFLKDTLEQIPDDKENPLEYERTLSMSLILLHLQEELNSFKDQRINDFSIEYNVMTDYAKVLTDNVWETYEGIIGIVEDDLLVVLKELNNLENRPKMFEYFKFLEHKMENFKDYTQIHLKLDETQDGDGIQPTERYIHPLRIIYQNMYSALTDFRYIMEKGFTYKDFEPKNVENIIKTNILNNPELLDLIKIIEEDKNTSFDRIVTHVNDELNKVSNHLIKDLNKESMKVEIISLAILETIREAIPKIEIMVADIKVLEKKEERIIGAVIDTLKIKKDSLKERVKDFQMAKKDAMIVHRSTVNDFKCDFDHNINEYLNQLFTNNQDVFAELQARFQNLVNKCIEINIDQDMKYLREEILVEVRTFEDLIGQSIIVLKNSSVKEVILFANKVETLFEEVISVIVKQDIELIQPQSGDEFDGKLHEIIVAEKSEDYEKGQIIKLENQGYIYEEKLLYRARVIAAK